MSMRILGALAVFCGLAAAAAPDASAQLTMSQVTAVQRCQDALNLQGRLLVSKAQSGLEGCSSAKLAPVLKDDNGVITPARFTSDNNRATATCNRLLDGIATQTTTMINAVVRSCGPVEALILAPEDPLGLVDIWGATTVVELAGLVCGEALTEVFFLAEGKIPRGLEIAITDPDISPSKDIDLRCDF